jgi:hypothetical protein
MITSVKPIEGIRILCQLQTRMDRNQSVISTAGQKSSTGMLHSCGGQVMVLKCPVTVRAIVMAWPHIGNPLG